MWSFGAFCDEFYVHTRLYLKLDLDPSRETVLHLFEQIRRAFPRMTRMRRRDDGSLVLEDDRDENHNRRYLRLDRGAMKFGVYGPSDSATVTKYSSLVLGHAPHHLSLSDLDFDYMDVVFGFDLEYNGNHDELVGETLFPDHPLLGALAGDDARVIDCQPFFGVSLNPDCDKQLYVEVKGRTSTFEVRTSEYESTPLSVLLTVRRYWGMSELPSLADVFGDLFTTGDQYASGRIIPHLVQPLAAAIASRR